MGGNEKSNEKKKKKKTISKKKTHHYNERKKPIEYFWESEKEVRAYSFLKQNFWRTVKRIEVLYQFETGELKCFTGLKLVQITKKGFTGRKAYSTGKKRYEGVGKFWA